MSVQTNVSVCSTGTNSGSQPPRSSRLVFHIPTNYELTEFHLQRVKLDKEGKKRPQQSLDNERSVISNWIVELKLDPLGPVGEELGVGFKESLADYEVSLANRNLSPRTISDRRCIIKKFRESLLEYQRTDGLPLDFRGGLRSLMELTGIPVNRLAMKTGVKDSTIRLWLSGRSFPERGSLARIRTLEKFFKVPEGTLSSRLPDALWMEAPDPDQTTAWRIHQRELINLKYRLSSFPDRLQEEWDELVLFFTDDQWVLERRLKRNSKWRVRWNNKRCGTAEINFEFLQSFFGYLCLPTINQDKRMVGLGFSQGELTLALLTDANLIFKYLYFMKTRSVSNSFNTATLTFLAFCSMLVRKKTGYLRQIPQFGERLPKQVTVDHWPLWCKTNYKKIRKFRKKITGKKSTDRPRMTRNSFEPVVDIIKNRQHPITALFDLAKNLESLTPLLERGSKERLALHHRNCLHVRMIGSNPLRIENFSMETFIPKDYGAFERAGELYRRRRENKEQIDYSELYVEATPESNLYQLPDGSWRLRFNERDFKNEKGEDLEAGVLCSPYDVPVLPSVWPSLVEYLFGGHRAVLNESIRDELRRVRSARGLPPLSSEAELAILRCPYVFRPGSRAIKKLGSKQLDGYGTAQISPRILSKQILALTRKYLPNCKGFGAHACRHLVASDYIKNHPHGYEEAAAALHNTAAMVRKHYAWVEISDLIKPWSNYHEQLKEKYDKGEI